MVQHPHQFSGGMAQRVVIALALAGRPRLLLADEPTTALDVTSQEQVMTLLLDLQRELGLSLLLVTHNLGLVAQSCDRVAVLYAAKVMELAPTAELFGHPRHPYTRALLHCVPTVDAGDTRQLEPVAGSPPDMAAPPSGCRFHPRCPLAGDERRRDPIPLLEVRPGHPGAASTHAAHMRTSAAKSSARRCATWATASRWPAISPSRSRGTPNSNDPRMPAICTAKTQRSQRFRKYLCDLCVLAVIIRR